jgi:hypothetical protein
MKKEVRKFSVNYQIQWGDETPISEIRKDLDALEKLGATEIDVYAVYMDYYPEVRMEAFSSRLETDEEYSARIASEKVTLEEVRQLEVAKMYAIKEKYGIEWK